MTGVSDVCSSDLYASQAFKKKPDSIRASLLESIFKLDEKLLANNKALNKDVVEWLQEHPQKKDMKVSLNVKGPQIDNSKGKRSKKDGDEEEDED